MYMYFTIKIDNIRINKKRFQFHIFLSLEYKSIETYNDL